MAGGQTRDKLAIQNDLLFEIVQTASWSTSSFPPRILSPPKPLCLSLQNAVGAEGTGTDVTGYRPHPFSTLPVLIGCSLSHGRRPAYSLPPALPWTTCLGFVWKGLVWRAAGRKQSYGVKHVRCECGCECEMGESGCVTEPN